VRDIKSRLLALAGLVVIVGGAMAILFLAGALGSQGGGEGIEDAVVLDPPRRPGQEDLDVLPREGSLAPDFEISDFDGARHRLSDFRGKPAYVNFWATWCGPCREELPEMQELLDRHEDDLAIITVNRREPLDQAKDFFNNDIEKLNGEPGVSFTVNGMDPDDTLYDEYRGLGMPVSVFVDADGKVVKVFNGRISLEIMEEAVAEAVASASASESEATGSTGS
jgi:thiol-disulfide isomerase/thioredoxin